MAGTLKSDVVTFGDTKIFYTIRRSTERRTLAITVCGPWVEIAAPAGMRASAIRPHVERKGTWILQRLDLARRDAPIYPQILRAGDSIRFFGTQHLLRIQIDPSSRPKLTSNARQFVLHLQSDHCSDVPHALFKRFFRVHLESRIPAWLEDLASKLKVDIPTFRVRELGNRWGICSAAGVLQFHWLLATQNPEFVQHVIAHELCHLIEPTHSRKFRNMLARISQHP